MRALIFLAAVAAIAQGQAPSAAKIGEIEFFGAAGRDPAAIRAALPVHEGDTLAFTEEAVKQVQQQVTEAIKRVAGHPPSDLGTVCCDDRGQWMIYIGLSHGGVKYNPRPNGTAKLAPAALQLYSKAMDLNLEAVEKGQSAEDESKGYALSAYPPYREAQLAMRQYALRHQSEIRNVLETSADADQRKAATQLLGFAAQSKSQINALAHAAFDPDSGVRNNAIRALAVLAASSPKVASQIPAARFIPLLSSGSWSDRNKSGLLLLHLTASRDPKLLADLRMQALGSMVEMARWRSPGHAMAYRFMLGRIAGIEEKKLEELAEKGQVQEILDLLPKTAK